MKRVFSFMLVLLAVAIAGSCQSGSDRGSNQVITPSMSQASQEVAVQSNSPSPNRIVSAPPQQKPVSVPGATPTEGGIPLQVHFFDAGSYDPDGDELVSWEWNFADEEEGQGGWHDYTETRGDAWHTYTVAGVYTAHLRVMDSTGRKGVGHIKITLEDGLNANPIAQANASLLSGNAPLEVTFSAEGSYDPDGNIVKWEWDFGTGTFLDYTPSHGEATTTYGSGGLYTAILRVTDDDGAVATNSVTIEVNSPPTAVASASPTSGVVPLTVHFSAQGSYDPDGFIVSYEWDFGEGGGFEDFTSTQGEADHTYIQPSTYTATLRVTDDWGEVITAGVVVTVYVGEWVHTWGGSGVEYGNAIGVDSSGNVYAAGYTNSFGAGNEDVILLKYDSAGNLVWQKTWGGSEWERGNSLAVDSNDNVLVVGYTNSFGAGGTDALLLKYDSNGNLIWSRTWGGINGGGRAGAVSVDGNGNVYVSGWTTSFGAPNLETFLLKYDSSGDLTWQRMWGGSGHNEYVHAMTVDTGGNAYLVGQTGSFGAGGWDAYILKYDSAGNLLWSKTWGGGGVDLARAVVVDSSGNVYLAGGTGSFGADIYGDVCLIKYNSSGNLLWQKTWGDIREDGSYGLAIGPTGSIYIAGRMWRDPYKCYDVLLLEFDSNGEVLLSERWTGAAYNEEWANALAIDGAGTLYICGVAPNAYGSWQSAIGAIGTPPGVTTSPIGASSSLNGVESLQQGIETKPQGVEDEGGGGDDVLVIKCIP